MEFLLNGGDIGVYGFIEQAGLDGVELLAATAKLAKRLRTAISWVSWSILAWR